MYSNFARSTSNGKQSHEAFEKDFVQLFIGVSECEDTLFARKTAKNNKLHTQYRQS